MRVVVLHDHFRLEPTFGVPLKPDYKHGRVLGAVVVYWLLAFEASHHILKLPYEASMGHCKHLVNFLLFLCLHALSLVYFDRYELISYIVDVATSSQHDVVPALTAFWRVLAQLNTGRICLLFENTEWRSLKDPATFLTETSIKPDFSFLLVAVPLHHTDVVPCLASAIEVTHAHQVKVLILEPESYLLGLFFP